MNIHMALKRDTVEEYQENRLGITESNVIAIFVDRLGLLANHSSTEWQKKVEKIQTDKLYMYSHPKTDCFVLSELFRVARQARFPKLGSKAGWLKRKSKILSPSHEETSASELNLNAYVSHLFCLHISA